MREMPLPGRTVLVTGAGSGIGLATARLLHEAGARPVLADRDADRLARARRALGGDVLTVPADVTDDAQVRALVEVVLDRHGRIDGLVNNAGCGLHQRVDEVDLDDFVRVLGLNVVSVLRLMHAVLPSMRAAGFGRIVNVSSGTTRTVAVTAGPYAASKAAVNMLSAVARAELGEQGIGVSIVLPSITATDFLGGRYALGEESWPGLITHSADYPARAILWALYTGVDEVVVPHGVEQPGLFRLPSG